jgi:hypothetical protein
MHVGVMRNTLTRAVCGLTGGRLKRMRCAASVRSAGYGSSFCSRGAGGATMHTWPASTDVWMSIMMIKMMKIYPHVSGSMPTCCSPRSSRPQT